MKLFKAEVTFKNKRRGRLGVDVLVHAKSRSAAEKHLAGKYSGCTVGQLIDLGNRTKHFALADLVE